MRLLTSCDERGEAELDTGAGTVRLHVRTEVLPAGGNARLGVLQDVSDHHAERVDLQRQGLTDPLTGLWNRRGLQEVLEQRTDRGSEPWVLHLIDVDELKLVNDTQGHEAGDALIVSVARSLQREAEQSGGTAARLGGDEFALVRPLPHDGVLAAEAQLRRAVSTLAGDVPAAEISIGSCPLTHRPDALVHALRQADVRMYEDKQLRRHSKPPRTGASAPNQRSRDADQALSAQQLQELLARGALTADFQPVFSAADRRLVAAEALARLRLDGATVLPDRFIASAERSGLVAQIDEHVAGLALDVVARWRGTAEGSHLCMGINVSVADLDNPGLPARLQAHADRAGVPMDALVIEVTESMLSRRDRGHEHVLHDLVERGCNVTLDDFGTGFSPLTYLQRFPVRGLKVDRHIARHLGDGTERDRLAQAVVRLGLDLGVHVVVEGIENPRQLDAARASGAPFLQGHLLGRPVAADAFERDVLGADPATVTS